MSDEYDNDSMEPQILIGIIHDVNGGSTNKPVPIYENEEFVGYFSGGDFMSEPLTCKICEIRPLEVSCTHCRGIVCIEDLKTNQWISVKDRPPTQKNILCLLEDGEVCVAKFPQGFHENGVVGGWECCYYCGGESKVSLHLSDYTIRRITHWMPLPEAPEK